MPGSEEYPTPTVVPEETVDPRQCVKVVSSMRQSFLLTKEGSVFTCGENDNNELGRSGKRSVFQRLDSLEGFKVVDLALGDGFAILVAKEGNILAWGRNESGQLGLGEGVRENISKPRPFSILKEGVLQIAAGQSHTMALSRAGTLYAWGANRKGQLGDGQLTSSALPKAIVQLKNRPIVKIACGADYSMCMTVGGAVFSWGDNAQGQLGQGDFTNRLRPEVVRTLRGAKAAHISCGKSHSAAISPSGLLFTWGSNAYGQLGHGQDSSQADRVVHTPRVVDKFHQSERLVLDVSLGAAHTLVMAEQKVGGVSERAVWVMGNGASGALGLGEGSRAPCFAPMLLRLDQQSTGAIIGAASGALSNHSFLFTEGVPLQKAPLPFVTLDLLRQACDRLKASAANSAEKVNATKALREMVAAAFSSVSVLNASFRLPGAREGLCIDLPQVRLAYHHLLDCSNEQLLSTLSRATLALTNELSTVACFDDAENLSCFLICLENPLLLQNSMAIACERLVNGLLALPTSVQSTLFSWLRNYPSEFFARIVAVLQNFLSYSMQALDGKLNAQTCRVLKNVYEVNRQALVVPEGCFVNSSIAKHACLLDERRRHLAAVFDGENARVFNFLQCPFLLSVQCKASFLRLDFEHSKALQQYRHKVKYLQGQQTVLPVGCGTLQREDGSLDCCFELVVRRSFLALDTFTSLLQVLQADVDTIRLPLRVRFADEDGIDQGGVSKEFFSLVLKDLGASTGVLAPTAGSGRFNWFTRTSSVDDDDGHGAAAQQDPDLLVCLKGVQALLLPGQPPLRSEEFCLGLLLGLASYNACLIDLRVPPCVYRLLSAGADPSILRLADLFEIDHSLACSLQALLEFEEGSLQDVFGVTMSCSDNPLLDDGRGVVDLIPGGREVFVSKANRRSFVKAFVEHALHHSVRDSLRSYLKGLSLFFHGVTVDMATANEKVELLCGTAELGDLSLLRLACTYRGGILHDEHPLIQWFWDMVAELPFKLKGLLLAFVTGSDRVPAGGLGELRLQVQHSPGDTDSLPSSHTCFNLLDLPLYASPEQLRDKMLLALEHGAQGFGLH